MAPQRFLSYRNVVGGCQLDGLLGSAGGQLLEIVQRNGGLGLASSHLTFLNYLYPG